MKGNSCLDLEKTTNDAKPSSKMGFLFSALLPGALKHLHA